MITDKLTLFSADSHVVEPPHCYTDYIDPKYRDRAPRYALNDVGGQTIHIEGLPPMTASSVASAGHQLNNPDLKKMSVSEVNRGAFDPKQRLLDQDADGVIGEIIYPSVGMFVCANEDGDYKNACFRAYNRWMKDEFFSYAPDRLVAVGQTAVRSVDEAIADVTRMKEEGFRGVMMPGEPATDVDYDDKSFDRLWAACVEMDMPISFHIFSSRAVMNVVNAIQNKVSGGRGPTANRTQDVLRNIQDIIGLFIWGGVFERNPGLKLVCTEADAGWAPHYMLYADHYYLDRPDRDFRREIRRKPSEYFMENVYMTFQRDWVALQSLHLLNPDHLLWANDFPHPDACWGQSQELLAKNAAHIPAEQKDRILRTNVMNVYGLTPEPGGNRAMPPQQVAA
jgi:predicted TIM-barrel fold metal-dependent hydrolase